METESSRLRWMPHSAIFARTGAMEGRIFAERDGPLRTGIAMVNPNGTTATVGFFLRGLDMPPILACNVFPAPRFLWTVI